MAVDDFPSIGRDYARLIEAMNEVLQLLSDDGDERAVLRASFEAAADGFGAENALLLLVEEEAPLRLAILHSRGVLTKAQLRACEHGESVTGVSPSVIRRVLETRGVELIEDPRLHVASSATSSLEGGDFSVLCAPILDPARGAVLAVVYFQNSGLTASYGEADRLWLQGYVTAVGRTLGLHFQARLRDRELRELRGAADAPEGAPELIGNSSAMQALRRELHEVYIPLIAAERPDPLLVLGERGTGKDLVARYLHAYSERAAGPFVAVNCAEITDELAASRFFGHRRGAFTGAVTDERGFFPAADKGVLFLDEVAELSPRGQACLLRVLENHTVVPVGQTREIVVDVAVILATNQDLDRAVSEGRLRHDFYDRFRAHVIGLPALRERPSDIPALLEHFRTYHERRQRKKTLGFTADALAALSAYGWSGNVRELARVCSVLVSRTPAGGRIDRGLVARFAREVLSATAAPRAASLLQDGRTMHDARQAFERELILARLEQHAGSVRATRESLGLTKSTFHRYARLLGIRASAAGSEKDGGED